jgi:hypothetical protein
MPLSGSHILVKSNIRLCTDYLIYLVLKLFLCCRGRVVSILVGYFFYCIIFISHCDGSRRVVCYRVLGVPVAKTHELCLLDDLLKRPQLLLKDSPLSGTLLFIEMFTRPLISIQLTVHPWITSSTRPSGSRTNTRESPDAQSDANSTPARRKILTASEMSGTSISKEMVATWQ